MRLQSPASAQHISQNGRSSFSGGRGQCKQLQRLRRFSMLFAIASYVSAILTEVVMLLGSKALQVWDPFPVDLCKTFSKSMNRMLEDPSYSQVVRWGDDGESFVVLEVDPSIRSGELRFGAHHSCRTKNSRNQSFPNTSSIAISQASSAN